MKDYAISGSPTLTIATWDEALTHRGSPLAPKLESATTSIECWETCFCWKVNPAVALAFFIHESGAGTRGYAIMTKNWGNLRGGPGEFKNDGHFGYYAAWVIGLNDWCKLLRGPLYAGAGLLTVSAVTPRYAPKSDNNDPLTYAADVNELCAAWEAMMQT